MLFNKLEINTVIEITTVVENKLREERYVFLEATSPITGSLNCLP